MSRQWHCWNCMARTGQEDEEEEQREENYVGNSQLMLSILNKKSSPTYFCVISLSWLLARVHLSYEVISPLVFMFYVCLIKIMSSLFSAAVIVDEVTNGCCWEMSTLKLEWDGKRRFSPPFFSSLSYRINTQFSAFFFFVSFCSNVHELGACARRLSELGEGSTTARVSEVSETSWWWFDYDLHSWILYEAFKPE